MKKTIILLLAIVATMSLSAQKYALHFNAVDGSVIAAGDTAVYTTTDIDMTVQRAYLYFYIENLTEDTLNTNNELVVLEGPVDLETEVCAGGNCPWDSSTYSIAPGDNPDMPFTIEPLLKPEYAGQHIIYRVTVGEGRNLENSVSVFLRVNISESNGIEQAVNDGAMKVYPNPTRGKVTIGDKEYDLSGRAAGVYYLPVKGGTARVIKL